MRWYRSTATAAARFARSLTSYATQGSNPRLADQAVPPFTATHTCEPCRGQAQSLLCTAACVAAGLLIPLQAAFLPLWLGYAAVTGTVAMGLWVLAHECGHGAFSDNRLLQVSSSASEAACEYPSFYSLTDLLAHSLAHSLQDAVGYVLHSAMLVPYFSWQVLTYLPN